MNLTLEMKEYSLGEGRLIYIPRWLDDPDAMFRDVRKLSFTPEEVSMYGKDNAIEPKGEANEYQSHNPWAQQPTNSYRQTHLEKNYRGDSARY